MKEMSKNFDYVIIGTGPAGTYCAQKLRKLDSEASIAMISDEKLVFYVREHLNRYIAEKETEDVIFKFGRVDEFCNRLKIEFFPFKVSLLKPKKHKIILEDGNKGMSISYKRLLIASGGKARTLPMLDIPENELNGVTTLYSLKDAQYILSQLKLHEKKVNKTKNIVIIGAGANALKMLPVFLKKNLNITIIEREKQILPNMLDEKAASILHRIIENKGVRVFLNTEVTEFIKHTSTEPDQNNENMRRIKAVKLKTDEILACELCIINIGIIPSTLFIDNKIVAIKDSRGGIPVDRFLQTKTSHIFAAGDVARIPDPIYNETPMPHPGWSEAKLQGEFVAMNLFNSLNNKPLEEYRGEVRINRMSFYDYSFVSAGIIKDTELNRLARQGRDQIPPNSFEIFIENDFENKGCERYKKLIFRNNKLIGAVLFGKGLDSKKWKKKLRELILQYYFFGDVSAPERSEAIKTIDFWATSPE